MEMADRPGGTPQLNKHKSGIGFHHSSIINLFAYFGPIYDRIDVSLLRCLVLYTPRLWIT